MNPKPVSSVPHSTREWLESDGVGGFSSGTVTGIRTRRYHALLLEATTPPAGRVVLVNGFEAWVETSAGVFPITSQRYAPDVVHPDGAGRVEAFGAEPWPHWILKLEGGTRIEQEIFISKGSQTVNIGWRLLGPRKQARLFVRPLLSGRDYHSLHKANPDFRFGAEVNGSSLSWHPYAQLPRVSAFTNGTYSHQPVWYYNFLYEEERGRGLDCSEDLASPGVLEFDLSKEEGVLMLTVEARHEQAFPAGAQPLAIMRQMRDQERNRRAAFPSPLHRAADDYIVGRGTSNQPANDSRKTIIAGYPWFTDWGRDTFIALRGLCLATGRLNVAQEILLHWSSSVSEGMLPNRFPDSGTEPEFNAVDASLWFVVVVHEFLEAARKSRFKVSSSARKVLSSAVDKILEGYSKGTRFGIRADEDGLLAAGVSGVQLTWMDAKIGDWVVTPRIGKPVEVQALWLNALTIGAQFDSRWSVARHQGLNSFRQKFWNAQRRCLFDVVEMNHQSGTNDPALRPNQIFAVGGLPFPVLDGEAARLVVEAVEDNLLTPLGLRSLAPRETGYAARYEGGVRERDGAYHQGTVWPWLIGAFVEAWLRVHGNTHQNRSAARSRFLVPLLAHLDEGGLGHISEIADADSPHHPRGCPFQAWSVGEVLRLDLSVLTEPARQRPGCSPRVLQTA